MPIFWHRGGLRRRRWRWFLLRRLRARNIEIRALKERGIIDRLAVIMAARAKLALLALLRVLFAVRRRTSGLRLSTVASISLRIGLLLLLLLLVWILLALTLTWAHLRAAGSVPAVGLACSKTCKGKCRCNA